MLDESEFKPFTLADFSVDEAPSAESAGSSSEKENGEDGANGTVLEISERLASFIPLTFDVEGDSVKSLSDVSTDTTSEKTDADKIQLSKGFKTAEFFSGK